MLASQFIPASHSPSPLSLHPDPFTQYHSPTDFVIGILRDLSSFTIVPDPFTLIPDPFTQAKRQTGAKRDPNRTSILPINYSIQIHVKS